MYGFAGYDAAGMPPAIRRRWSERFPGVSPYSYNVVASWTFNRLIRLGDPVPLVETTAQTVRRQAFIAAWDREAKAATATVARRELEQTVAQRTREVETQRQREAAPGPLAGFLGSVRATAVIAAVALALLLFKSGGRHSW